MYGFFLNQNKSHISYTNDCELYKIGNWMDIVNRVILSTVLMILSSIIFLNSIWNLNQRI